MLPARLKPGDEIRVIAPSRSLSVIWPEMHDGAVEYWQQRGHHVTFARRSRELEDFMSPGVDARVEDIHEAFADPQVKMIISCIGGFSCNSILPRLDYDLIARNPKILCGYSDVTALLNAVHARTGMVTYHGPHFSTFGLDRDPGRLSDAVRARRLHALGRGCVHRAPAGLLRGCGHWRQSVHPQPPPGHAVHARPARQGAFPGGRQHHGRVLLL